MLEQPVFQIRTTPRSKLPPVIEIFHVTGSGLLPECHEVLTASMGELDDGHDLHTLFRRFAEEVLHIEIHDPEPAYHEVVGYDELEAMLSDLLDPSQPMENCLDIRDELVRRLMQHVREEIDPEETHTGMYL